MKKLIILIFSIYLTNTVLAQSHTYDACCRYSKGNVKGDCVCPGCKKDNDDEKAALQEETRLMQKKAAVEIAQNDAVIKKAAEDGAKKSEASRNQRESNTVYLGSPRELIKNTGTQVKKAGNTTIKKNGYTGKLYPKLYFNNNQQGVALTDKQGDTILKTTEYTIVTNNIAHSYNVEEMPDNIAILYYANVSPSFYPNVSFYPQNLINSKGQKLLKAENINSIKYCKNNFFLIYKGGGTTNDTYDGATSISLYDYTRKTFQEIKKTLSPTANYINYYGIDMKDYMVTNGLFIKDEFPNGVDDRMISGLIPEYRALLKGSNWLLTFDIIIDVGYGTTGRTTRQIYFVDKNRNLKELGIFTESR